MKDEEGCKPERLDHTLPAAVPLGKSEYQSIELREKVAPGPEFLAERLTAALPASV
jgi:hypothetical protein